MGISWTDDQLKAINARGSNVLVAAAAGSGKTAVLVERIIRRICEKENPLSVDRLLVLTFTEAAASEMKRKISDAIDKKLKEEPENKRLREQKLLVNSSHISTVHSFCKTILQNNIHSTDLPADFSIMDENENKILLEQSLDLVLESYYSRIEKNKAFRDLAVGYGGIKSDDNLRGAVLSLYYFVRSLAFPERWLKECIDIYKMAEKDGGIENTLWADIIIKLSVDGIKEAGKALDEIWKITDNEIMSDHKVYSYFKNLRAEFKNSFGAIMDKEPSYSEIKRAIDSFSVERIPPKRGIDDIVMSRINRLRKDIFEENLAEVRSLFADTEMVENSIKCLPRIKVLKQLVRQTDRLHRKMKLERSALDFGDLEHEMIKLLSDKKGKPTETALRLQTAFDEILVDEYQDTNNIQDTIFSLLSKNNDNIFMVGDIKQSIYRFRNANPNIFADKYEAYGRNEGGICIKLFKNFRSRREVIDSVNGIFSNIMSKELGGVDYTQDEYLVNGAAYPESYGNNTEILLTETTKIEYSDSEYAEMSDHQLEAVTISRRIWELINSGYKVTDKKTGNLRPVRLGDIAILSLVSSHIPELVAILDEYEILTTADSGRSFLSSLEVMTVLNFLQIIDNPRQDIPLAAVLRSSIFNFTEDELAQIRLYSKESFYDALTESAKEIPKAKEFISQLEELRGFSPHMGVDELIWKICNDFHYRSLVGAMPGGRTRQANLDLLYEMGAEFEKGTLSGLFNFMSYIEKISATDSIQGAKTIGNEDDTVKIMTIHKSKGLEFPVVILFGCRQLFNDRDLNRGIIWHQDMGIAMDYVDVKQRVRYPTVVKSVVKNGLHSDGRAEAMRVMYVALTRAKEKMIISSTISNRDNKWMDAIFLDDSKISSTFLKRRRTMRDWILSAVLNHPDSEYLRNRAERYDIKVQDGIGYHIDIKYVHHILAHVEYTPFKEEIINEEKTTEVLNEIDLKQRLEYVYPGKGLIMMPIKLSVSEIKRRQMPESNYVPYISAPKNIILNNSNEFDGAEKGTITHYVLQHMDFSKTDTLEEIVGQINNMVQVGLINEKQADAVSADSIYSFFASELGKRLKNSKEFKREFDFYMEIPAQELKDDLGEQEGDEKILLQGIADCFFYEDDGVVLIDYKTDSVTEETVARRAENYRIQIDYYTRGLNSILEVPIKERYLYFLNCNREVKI